MEDISQVCSVWVGSETGLLKGENDITQFSTEEGIITETRQSGESNQGRFTGLAATDRYSCTGLLRVWKEDNTDKVNEQQLLYLATGGKENECKSLTTTFQGITVRNDWLDLRVPEWVRDMAFITDSDKMDTCTAQHQVCLSFPVQCMIQGEAVSGVPPSTDLSLPANQDSVTVGNTYGQLAILGLRKGELCGCFKGAGRRGVGASVPPFSLVASCGLDRFLRVHSLEDRSLRNKYVYSLSPLFQLGSTGVNRDVEEVKEDRGELDKVWNTVGMIKEKAKKRETDEAVVEEAEKMKLLLKRQRR
uniref:WD repeat domain 74 n=1 Tax=Oncorhynchus kisutch TaxID=8019 RepID=A0A8C7JI86_ONCKI